MIGNIICIILLCCLGGCIFSCSAYERSPEGQAAEAQRKAECNTPKLYSEIDGVKLYRVQPDCYHDVYFSKSGTTYEEREGKHTVTVGVPNTQ